jgi:hypothetical protein
MDLLVFIIVLLIIMYFYTRESTEQFSYNDSGPQLQYSNPYGTLNRPICRKCGSGASRNQIKFA